jgi:hypothetical protein
MYNRCTHARSLFGHFFTKVKLSFNMSVTNMQPGRCVRQIPWGFASSIALTGVTPHAQKAGISPGLMETASP